jgi:RNA polymerase sigma factor (sigma-70 family)
VNALILFFGLFQAMAARIVSTARFRFAHLEPDDVADMAFVRFANVYEVRYSHLEPDTSAAAGVAYQFCLHVTRELLREQRPDVPLDEVDPSTVQDHVESVNRSRHQQWENDAGESLYDLALRLATPTERAVFELWYRGYPPAVIAAELGMSVQTVYKHHSRLMSKIRKELGVRDPVAPPQPESTPPSEPPPDDVRPDHFADRPRSDG